eukprot:2889730-Rhodomonas_salina.1
MHRKLSRAPVHSSGWGGNTHARVSVGPGEPEIVSLDSNNRCAIHLAIVILAPDTVPYSEGRPAGTGQSGVRGTYAKELREWMELSWRACSGYHERVSCPVQTPCGSSAPLSEAVGNSATSRPVLSPAPRHILPAHPRDLARADSLKQCTPGHDEHSQLLVEVGAMHSERLLKGLREGHVSKLCRRACACSSGGGRTQLLPMQLFQPA